MGHQRSEPDLSRSACSAQFLHTENELFGEEKNMIINLISFWSIFVWKHSFFVIYPFVVQLKVKDWDLHEIRVIQPTSELFSDLVVTIRIHEKRRISLGKRHTFVKLYIFSKIPYQQLIFKYFEYEASSRLRWRIWRIYFSWKSLKFGKHT